MADIEKVKTGIFEMLQRNTWEDIENERHRFQPVLNDALALLKELNTKGHWIPIGGVADCNGVRIHSFKCSECGERTDRVDTNRHINFCPMCGTAMEENETH